MKPKVFYNDECLICKIEINHYKRKTNSLDWKGIHSLKNIKEQIDIEPKKLIRKLHVKFNDKIFVGVDAFILIWSHIPKYKKFSKLIKLPIIYHLAIIIYEFLAILLYIKNFNQIKKITKK